ncbi:MAG: hypothetical protein CL847_06265 [Crocinitomicaceae bacterium]|nr:hypothetical protein [Crocinitomicaceae bacterium]|tara:strand:- start:3979 stop:4281 length:303 start_codon:yes stop_codon:yes gene_type:complete
MKTLNSTTEKLVKATERLLQKLEEERALSRKNIEDKIGRIRDLEAQVEKLNLELSEEKESSKNLHISKTKNQSQDTDALSAQNIDALVEEIDACLNLLKI